VQTSAQRAVPRSSLPTELLARGYDVTGDGERIAPTAISVRFCTGADGELEPLTSGSTRAVAQVVTHVGVCRVKRHAFSVSNPVSNGDQVRPERR
jgi:hypothetical protein